MDVRPSASMDQPVAVLVRLDPGGPGLCPPAAPFLRADDTGVLRGDGVFERFLVLGGQPHHFEDHLARMARLRTACELAAPGADAWREAVAVAIETVAGGRRMVDAPRLHQRPGGTGDRPSLTFLARSSVRLSRANVRPRRCSHPGPRMPSELGDEAPWLLLGAKTLSYAVNMAAKRWAESKGRGRRHFVGTTAWCVGGGATRALWFPIDGAWLAPPPGSGSGQHQCGRAVQRGRGGRLGRSPRKELKVHELFEADGVWLSSSIRFTRVHTLDGEARPLPPAHEKLVALSAASEWGKVGTANSLKWLFASMVLCLKWLFASHRVLHATTSSHRPNLRPDLRVRADLSNPQAPWRRRRRHRARRSGL